LILVDSSVWVDYFKGTITAQTARLDGLLGNEPLAIGDLILTEVLQGFHDDRDFNHARRVLTALTVVEFGRTGHCHSSREEFSHPAQEGRNRPQDHRYGDCNPMHRERV
jgi:hypothetical protein